MNISLAMAMASFGYTNPNGNAYYNSKNQLIITESITESLVIRRDTLKCYHLTFDEAFNFIRNKYHLDSYCRQVTKNLFYFEINYIAQNDEGKYDKHYSDYDCISYEDSQIKCLKKLIQIIKKDYDKEGVHKAEVLV